MDEGDGDGDDDEEDDEAEGDEEEGDCNVPLKPRCHHEWKERKDNFFFFSLSKLL